MNNPPVNDLDLIYEKLKDIEEKLDSLIGGTPPTAVYGEG